MDNVGDGWRLIVSPLGSILRSFWSVSRSTILLVLIVVLGSSLATVFAPYLFSRIVDRMVGDRWPETIAQGFLLYAGLIGLVLTLQNVVKYLAAMEAENLNFVASTRFFEKLVTKSPKFFVENNPAEIQSAQMHGAQALNVVGQLALMVLIPGFVQLALSLAVLGAAIDVRVVLVVLIYGAIFISLTYFSNIWTRPHLENAVSASQRNAQLIGNTITSMETLRYFSSAGWMSDRFRNGAGEVLDNWRRYCLKRILYAGVYGVALALQFAITFAIFLPRYRQGFVSVGDIVLFNSLLLQLNQPFEMVGLAIESLVRSYAQFRPFASMWTAPEEQDKTISGGFDPDKGKIEFKQVGFLYEDGRGITDVSFIADRGKVTLITGETGSGKSTILKLALKTLEPTAGKVCVGEKDLSEINRHDWYRTVGVVPQEIMLLNDTLRSNITLGRARNDTQLYEAAAKAAILDRIKGLPEGFETFVGERGLKLSGGERQRIAIARALYGNPKFLFLDEASSALDDATEAEIMNHVRKIANEVTVIAITHRKDAIQASDMIVDLTFPLIQSHSEGERPG